ncbi:MAG: disulfide oxidoreductase [Actinomycetota bacterium]
MNARTIELFFALLTVGADAFIVVALVLRLTGSNAWTRFREAFAPSALWFAWIVAVVCTAGSLYLSEVRHFTPCALCWYQRIGMYPLTLILGIAAFRRDFSISRYVVPLASAAALISAYHYQLERFPAQTHGFCTLESPCTFVWIWRFHFISIPFMALSGFLLIVTLLTLRPRDVAEASKAESPQEEAAA